MICTLEKLLQLGQIKLVVVVSVAGDHVKFGLPMASSATLILHGLEFMKEGYEYAGQFGMGLRQVRWALEYFRKCYVDKDRFYAQV